MATHPTPEQLKRFGEGRLDTGDFDQVAVHVETCDTCIAYLQTVPEIK